MTAIQADNVLQYKLLASASPSHAVSDVQSHADIVPSIPTSASNCCTVAAETALLLARLAAAGTTTSRMIDYSRMLQQTLGTANTHLAPQMLLAAPPLPPLSCRTGSQTEAAGHLHMQWQKCSMPPAQHTRRDGERNQQAPSFSPGQQAFFHALQETELPEPFSLGFPPQL